MSTPKGAASKPRKERERDKKEHLSQPPVSTERLKTVVRRLPPNLPEDIFWQSVHSWVSDETVTWKIFYPGKMRKRLNKENIPSRAYIAFKTEEQLAQFSRDWYVSSEFAPYQKAPPEKKKADARSGTIENGAFSLTSLNAQASNTEPVSLETLIAATHAPPPPKTTPLLEALKAEKSAQREKETALRQIAQQKRDEAKKKNTANANANANAPSTSTTGAPLSKKLRRRLRPLLPRRRPKERNPASRPGNAAPPRPPKAPKAAANPRAQPRVPGPPAVPTDVSVASAANPGPSNANGDPAPGPRRARPVIGLASRQFEAALSGAGVAGPGAGGERKSRRERERERAACCCSGCRGQCGCSCARWRASAPQGQTTAVGAAQGERERRRGHVERRRSGGCTRYYPPDRWGRAGAAAVAAPPSGRDPYDQLQSWWWWWWRATRWARRLGRQGAWLVLSAEVCPSAAAVDNIFARPPARSLTAGYLRLNRRIHGTVYTHLFFLLRPLYGALALLYALQSASAVAVPVAAMTGLCTQTVEVIH
ncbi:hypothetical protein B0H11DRAFT_2231081 [Mycena galericulata]|nr:hypothetical protein B0H11DRAFT_2231081 [Mycena galericulata]